MTDITIDQRQRAESLKNAVLNKAIPMWKTLFNRTRTMLRLSTSQLKERDKFGEQLAMMAQYNAFGPPLMFYYSSDELTREVVKIEALKSSAGVPDTELQSIHTGHFPVGLYGTNIPPWDLDQNQRTLADAFYSKGYSPDISYFVAFIPEVWHWKPVGYITYPEFAGKIFWHWNQRLRGNSPRSFKLEIKTGLASFVPIHYVYRGKSLIPPGTPQPPTPFGRGQAPFGKIPSKL